MATTLTSEEGRRLFIQILNARPTESQLERRKEWAPSHKAARVLGELKLAETAEPRAFKNFSVDADEDSVAVRKADHAFARDRSKAKKAREEKRLAEFETVLSLLPNGVQQSLPDAQKKNPTSLKALDFFGSEVLDKHMKDNIEFLPFNRDMSTKVARVLGSASVLAPAKASRMLGSDDVEDLRARTLSTKILNAENTKKRLASTNKGRKLSMTSDASLSIDPEGIYIAMNEDSKKGKTVPPR